MGYTLQLLGGLQSTTEFTSYFYMVHHNQSFTIPFFLFVSSFWKQHTCILLLCTYVARETLLEDKKLLSISKRPPL